MKKSNTIILLACMTGFSAYSQQNIFPANGNTGIGVTNPSVKLQVHGKVKIDSILWVNDSLLIQKDARIKKNLIVEQDVIVTNLHQSNGLLNKKLIVRNETDKKMEIIGFDELAKFVYSKECQISSDGLGDVIDPMWKNGINKIFIECPQVSVGIGTTLPRFKLDVQGGAFATKLSLGEPNYTNFQEIIYIKTSSSINVNRSLFLIENASRKVFQINNNGQVRAREIKVDLLNWADYVFVSGYKLMPLNEVEKYIQAHGHLPDVPSAKEIETDGLNLGETDKILMQKIEELTLYVIEQEKQIKALQAENEASKQARKKRHSKKQLRNN